MVAGSVMTGATGAACAQTGAATAGNDKADSSTMPARHKQLSLSPASLSRAPAGNGLCDAESHLDHYLSTGSDTPGELTGTQPGGV